MVRLMKKLTVILIYLFSSFLGQAQNEEGQALLESGQENFKNRDYSEAQKELAEAANFFAVHGDYNSTLHARLLLASAYLHDGKSDLSFPIYKEAFRRYDEITEDTLKVKVLFSLSTMYQFRSQYDSVMVLQKKSLGLKNIGDDFRSDSYTLLSACYAHKGDADSALIMTNKALTIDFENSDSSSLVYNLQDLGKQYLKLNENDSAIYYMIRSLDFLRPGKDDFKIPIAYERISKVFTQIENYDKALEYAARGAEFAQENNLPSATERCLIYKADNLRFLSRNQEALKAYNTADSLNEISKKPERTYLISRGIVLAELALNIAPKKSRLDKIKAFQLSTQSERERVNSGLLLLEASIYAEENNEAKFYSDFEQLKEEEIIKTDLYLEKNLLRIKQDFEKRNSLWENLAFTTSALNSLNAEIRKNETSQIVYDIEGKYQKKEQDLKIKNLDSENKLKNRIIWMGAVALGLISILSFFLFRLYRKVTEQKSVISTSLTEKDTLLREIHHRVKNNLQVVSSLLRLQTDYTKDENTLDALKEGQSRVQSMSLIHQNLYSKDNLTGINMKTYLEDLVSNLFSTYDVSDGNIKLETDIQDLKLDVDSVVPIGLIINELVTNSLKYAFPDKKAGKISVSLKESEEKLVLTVADNGVGKADISEVKNSDSFGMGLIQSFCTTLDAELSISGDDGFRTELIISDYLAK